VTAAPAGLGKSELAAAFGRISSARTIARRLSELVASGRLVTTGKARALRYVAAPIRATANIVEQPDQIIAEGEVYVPVSAESRKLLEHIRKPVAQRRPVGYRREFLERYVPNRTRYLPAALRKRLMAMGEPYRDQRPAGTYARDILNRLLIDLSWASSRLEGNTYTRLETQRLIEFGAAAEGKDQREAQMILNHKAAIEMLVENVDEVGFNMYTFKNLHANLSENLLADPTASGRLRTQIVEIAGSVYHPPAIPQQVEGYFAMILRKADAIDDPFEQAFFVMAQIPYLQPFIDVNKRVSRLGANIPFLKRNLVPLSFVDVPERAYFEGTLCIYELNRIELLRDVFAWAYERSCQRFLAVSQNVAAPDPVRLRYREALSAVIGDLVRAGERPTQENVWNRARKLVREEDQDRFVEIALRELANLHEGNVARFRLRLSEYKSWKQRKPPASRKGR
jgi:Fic/DOC family